MKPYVKHWLSALQKAQTLKTGQVTPKRCINLKIRMSRIQLETAFEYESRSFLAEFRKPAWCDAANCKEYTSVALNSHLEALYTACLKDYLNLCVLNYCSGVMGFRKGTVIKNQEGVQAHSMDVAVAVLADRVRSFYAQKEDTRETLTKLVDTAEKITDKLLEEIAERIRSGWRMLDNKAYELQIEGKLLGIRLTGRTQYQYVCENSSSSCSVCADLHGKHFDLQEAQAGQNLPPMHPNCRCTIEEYPPLPELPDSLDILDFTLIGKLLGDLEIALQRMALDLDNVAEGIGAIWSYFFGKSFHDFYGTFTTIELGGVEYQINKNTFSAVAIGPDGNFVVPENVSAADAKLLELMRQRDALPPDSDERPKIEAEIQSLFESIPDDERKVNPKNTYAFYVLGGDVTEQLNAYMRQTEIDYANMHDRYWVENLRDFMSLVGNSSLMDLKNQPEWQHSACVYDGEIVDQDAMGNINYGFFGRHCNIPESVLIAGAGYAQVRAGTSDWGFMITFFDDPRDSYRVMQGVDIYEQWH